MKDFEVQVETTCYYRFSVSAKDWDEAQDNLDQMTLEDILEKCEEPRAESFHDCAIIGEL